MKGGLLSGFALDKAVLATSRDGLLLAHRIEQSLTCFHYWLSELLGGAHSMVVTMPVSSCVK